MLPSCSARAALLLAWVVECEASGAGPPDGVRLAWHPALQDVLAVAAGTRVLLVALDDLGPPTNGPVRAGRNAASGQDQKMSACAVSLCRNYMMCLRVMESCQLLPAAVCKHSPGQQGKVRWRHLAGIRVHRPHALRAACQVVCDTDALPDGAVALPGAAGGALTDIAFAPGGHLLAAGGRDGQARTCA